ncbi:hypothetical protein NM208_g16580 [Fusarium decemcellulare]|uniref:Uncharacterized protein n=1 Tax=Fusarium decemcellulare TaxID=57161 RepID=A0ACC1RBP5_9HYPO|nr:hypothetical protein NM208_g16580 [Fusarium decemcellulare]
MRRVGAGTMNHGVAQAQGLSPRVSLHLGTNGIRDGATWQWDQMATTPFLLLLAPALLVLACERVIQTLRRFGVLSRELSLITQRSMVHFPTTGDNLNANNINSRSGKKNKDQLVKIFPLARCGSGVDWTGPCLTGGDSIHAIAKGLG